MKKGNILLHGIGKILFCMIGSVLIIGEMIVIGNPEQGHYESVVTGHQCSCGAVQ